MEEASRQHPLPVPITQEQYRELLEADMAAAERFIEFGDAPAEERWRCRKCGAPAKVTIVAHPIWDGPFEGAGRGKCDYREVPFCPHCDGEKPEWESGAPIRIQMMPGQPARVMQRLSDQLFRFGLPGILIRRASTTPKQLGESHE